MATLRTSQLDRLQEAREEWWVWGTLCQFTLACAVLLSVLILFLLSDVVLAWSQPMLWLLFSVWIGGSFVVLARVVHCVLWRRPHSDATARQIELAVPELGSSLINLVQLARGARSSTDPFWHAALAETEAQVGRVNWKKAAESRPRRKRWDASLQTGRDLAELLAGLAAVILCAVLLQTLIPSMGSSLSRIFQPWKYVPRVGAVQILEVSPGTTHVLAGATVTVVARIAPRPGANRRPGANSTERITGTLYALKAGEREEVASAMLPDASGTEFSAILASVAETLRYRVQIGDSESERYAIYADPTPAPTSWEVTYDFPAYLALPVNRIVQSHGDLEAPAGAIARVTCVNPVPISRASVRHGDRAVAVQIATEDRRRAAFTLPLIQTGDYTIHLVDEHGNTDPAPRVNAIRVVPDAPPTVQLVRPAGDLSVAPGGSLPTIVRLADDHGLGAAWLEWRLARESGDDPPSGVGAEETLILSPSPNAERTWHSWSNLNGVTATTLAHTVPLEASSFTAGQHIEFRAVAVDLRRLAIGATVLEPQTSVTPWRRVTVVSSETKAREKFEKWENAHSGLWAILRAQVRARVNAAGLAATLDYETATRVIPGIVSQQLQIQTATSELASSLGGADATEDEQTLKRALSGLAREEMIRAVQVAETLARFQRVEEIAEPVGTLLEVQDAIIAALRRLLDATRAASVAAMTQVQERSAGDLPADVTGKLVELSARLQEFLPQQRRVIEATENLAKRHVEDFSSDDERQLAELAAVEDEWSRFLEEQASDFSKLPEQDFANASLLKELVDIQTELKQAADALTRKSAEIAVPLEQLGVEMAEELLTNIEKWLPDTPDRERWRLEEPPPEDLQNAPMAELTGELEDLVGELMEEEEDLFDELEDVSSSWADSIDKGAGWDAMDGPISNMSARGVTGNRLPNSSEIGGRSGEGRQGRASGEFVGDSAVGKGGRKTPSRLAPDPVVAGQIQDSSKDPVGGATGGGKESGVGGEGLEGPVREQMQRDLARLANRQADLRNRAEGVDLKFQILNYHRTDLQRLLETMRNVETDLRSGRYQNALRQRTVIVDDLEKLKMYVDGEFQVRSDESQNLPADIQQDLLGSMSEAAPPGWESLNRKYFERLSRSPSSASQTSGSAPRSHVPAGSHGP